MDEDCDTVDCPNCGSAMLPTDESCVVRGRTRPRRRPLVQACEQGEKVDEAAAAPISALPVLPVARKETDDAEALVAGEKKEDSGSAAKVGTGAAEEP